MELIRGWLTQVVCAALLAAAADGLMAKGPIKKVGNLVCAMVFLCAVLRPVVHWSISIPEAELAGVREQSQQRQEQLKLESGTMLKTLIEQQLGAYISDKAANLGAACQVEVVCEQQDGMWCPQSVRITGQLDEVQRSKLTSVIRNELGVSPECLFCTGGE